MGSGNSKISRKKGKFKLSSATKPSKVKSTRDETRTTSEETEGEFDEFTQNHEASNQDITPLTYSEAASLRPSNNDNIWAIVQRTCANEDSLDLNSVKNRRGWKTIRLFVSSTFRDFHAEREVLVKEVRKNSQNNLL